MSSKIHQSIYKAIENYYNEQSAQNQEMLNFVIFENSIQYCFQKIYWELLPKLIVSRTLIRCAHCEHCPLF